MDTSAHITPVDDDATRTSASEGLEEGEVEGETLLLVESEDQASIDLSHDQSGDSLNSDIGDDIDPPWMEEIPFHCDKCQKWIPASQLRGDPPSYLKGDNFFKFTCSDCSEDGKEQYERLRLTWQQVVMLAMYNLSLEGSGRQGYFRWKEDICSFIEKHWTFLLGNSKIKESLLGSRPMIKLHGRWMDLFNYNGVRLASIVAFPRVNGLASGMDLCWKLRNEPLLQMKKTSTWWSTVAGCLSVGSPMFFKSGAQEFGEPGWWKLVHNRPPAMRPEGDKYISSQKIKTPGKSSLDPVITVEGPRKRSRGNPVESAIELKEKRSRTQEAKDIRRAQKEASGFVDRNSCSTPVKFSSSRSRRPDIVLEKGEVIDFSSMSSSDRTPMTSPSPSPSLDFSAPGTPASHSATPSLLSEADLIPDVMPPQALFHDDEDMDVDGVIDPGIEYLPSPHTSHSTPICQKNFRSSMHVKQEIESEEERLDRVDCELHKGPSVDRARDKRRPQPIQKDKNKNPQYHAISLYEEKLLLKRLEACPNAVAVTPEARRLRQKLFIRKAKRERGLPPFDLDQAVNAALMLVGGVYGAREGSVSRPIPTGPEYRTTSNDLRVLDRYQTAVPATKDVRHSTVRFLYRLGAAEDKDADLSIVSPYTARILKPYIRRDYETTRPSRLQLLAEIRAFAHRDDPSWVPETQSPIDYCYVRPGHIPTINSICQEFFWPGIDVSECLQYPDFSVVVLYKKVIIAFGFMVPDVKYNEAYISFLFVHPEWRRAGIATFMIYHLIQTCMGKDVTLHVSANSPAMLLYQKFGFKTEEYVLDFYDKYFPIDSKECKHAFFLRLRR